MLHQTLKLARLRARLTMSQVAGRSSISQSQLSRIEAGMAGVTSQRLVDLAALYGVSPSKLLEGAVVGAMSDTDLDRIGEVIELVETTLRDNVPRPAPDLIRTAVLTIFRHETAKAHDSAKPFDTSTYREILLAIVGAGGGPKA